MFKFLFGKKSVEVVKETQRETIARAMGEVNEVLSGMAVRPKVAVNLETGLIEIELPEQMPDEALALPAPEAKTEKPEVAPKPGAKDGAEDKVKGKAEPQKAAT
jgi:hypothetical protein